jgi:hypothetical protein
LLRAIKKDESARQKLWEKPFFRRSSISENLEQVAIKLLRPSQLCRHV